MRSVILEAFFRKIPNAAQKTANYNPLPCAGEKETDKLKAIPPTSVTAVIGTGNEPASLYSLLSTFFSFPLLSFSDDFAQSC